MIPIVKTIAITIDEAMLATVDKLAGNHPDTPNRSKIIRAAIGEYLARLDREAEETREREIFRRHRGTLRQQAAALVKEQAKS
jgi:metal-responsive CopG/Arc/MetJ family transcriptional regulator